VSGSILDVAWGGLVSSVVPETCSSSLREELTSKPTHRRIATEINMSKELSEERLNDYRARTPLTPKMAELLQESCSRTWHLLWSGNLMYVDSLSFLSSRNSLTLSLGRLAVHTGRIIGKSFIGGRLNAMLGRDESHLL
jgi:hypothetical protein